MQKHYLKDKAAFESLSREWPVNTPTPPAYPCFVVWHIFAGVIDWWVVVEYVLEEDFKQNIKQ